MKASLTRTPNHAFFCMDLWTDFVSILVPFCDPLDSIDVPKSTKKAAKAAAKAEELRLLAETQPPVAEAQPPLEGSPTAKAQATPAGLE